METELIIAFISVFAGGGGIGGMIGTKHVVNGLAEDVKDIKKALYGPGSLDHRVTFLEANKSSEE